MCPTDGPLGVAEATATRSENIITTLRKARIEFFDVSISIFDLSGTLLISYLIARKFDLNPLLVMFASIPIGYLVHDSFQISTPLTNKINNKLSSK